MSDPSTTPADDSELTRLHRQVDDLEQALEAIRSGDVDVPVVGGNGRVKLYSQTAPERPYQQLVEQMAAAMLTLSAQGRILFANHRLAEWLHSEPAVLIGQPLLDLLVEEDRPVVERLLRESAPGPRQLPLGLTRSDGETVSVLAALETLELEGERLVCLVAIRHTAAAGSRRVAAPARPAGRARPPTPGGLVRAGWILAGSGGGLLGPWRRLVLLWLVQLGVFLLDMAQRDLVLLPFYWVPVVLSVSFASPRQTVALALPAFGLAALAGLRWSQFSAVDYWVRLAAMLLLTLASLILVRQRQASERRRQDSEERYRLLAENASDVVFRASLEGITEWIAPSVTALLGLSPDVLIGAPFSSFVHPQDLETLRQADAAFARGERRNFRLRVLHRAGGYRWVAVNARGLVDPQGRVTGTVGSWRDIQAEVEAEQGRAQERARLLATFEAQLDPHVVLQARRDASGAIVDFVYAEANQAACRYNLLSHDQLIGRSVLGLLPAHRATGLLEMYCRVIETGEPLVLDGFAYPHELLGEVRRFDIRAVPLGDELSFTWRDVTDRHEAERRLAASEELYRLLASNATDVVIRLRDDINIWTSPSVTEMFGWQPSEWMGHHTADFVHPDDLEGYRAAVQAIDRGERVVARSRVRASDGSWHWVQVHAGPYRDQQGQPAGLVASLRLIDEQIAAERKLERQARTDDLTGLLNRREVLEQIDRLAAPEQRSGQSTALLFCDLDCFKQINDRYGHAAGDELLTAVADRLRACLRREDLAARVGGDELLVLLRHVQSLENAVAIAEKLRAAVMEPVVTAAGEVRISLSIGVTLMLPGEGADALMARADAAMYQAKQCGRNRVIPIEAGPPPLP